MTPPETPEDFVDIIQCLNAEGCDYLVVGAHALAAHGSPRATGDLDIFVRPDDENASLVVRALVRFGAPLAAHGITTKDFEKPGTVYQLGLPPRRVDILTELTGVDFAAAAANAVSSNIGGKRVRCIGLRAMLANKRATGRPKDLADAEVLEELLRLREAAGEGDR